MSGAPRSSKPARDARHILEEALNLLRNEAEFERARSHIEKASHSLGGLEGEGPPSREYGAIQSAVSELGAALGLLQSHAAREPIDHAIEAVARTLALLYPHARRHQRRRRRGMLEPIRAPVPWSGADKRTGGERVPVEVDIGLVSESHFYTGLSRDLSRGGVFVATYQPKARGTRVALYFALPSGRAIHAEGVVRWTSDARGELPPGMGVAFEQLGEEDRRAIVEFCETRSPLYHHDADD